MNAIYCNFAQIEALKRELLNAPNTIVGSSRDTVWGTGIPLHERDALI